MFFFASDAKERFENGNLQVKKEILSVLGQNFILKDKKLTLEPVSWLEPIYKNWLDIKSKYDRLELAECSKDLGNKGNEEVLASVIPIWGS